MLEEMNFNQLDKTSYSKYAEESCEPRANWDTAFLLRRFKEVLRSKQLHLLN